MTLVKRNLDACECGFRREVVGIDEGSYWLPWH